MADLYGIEAIPLAAPTGTDAVSDRAISLFGAYFSAVLNARAPLAWAAVAPAPTGTVTALTMPVVRAVLTHDPRKVSFAENQLPAIYMDRASGERPVWQTEDWRILRDSWTLLWVFPPAVQATQRARNSITSGIVKVIDRAVEQCRDPAWVATGDTDETAATVAAAPTAIKTSIASAVTAQSYTGAALNGAIGAGAISPPRLPSVTVSGTAADVLADSIVTFTGTGADGTARVSRVTLAAAAGTYYGDWSLSAVSAIDVPAQTGTGALFTFGLAAFTGLGSIPMVLAGLQEIEVRGWKDITFTLAMEGAPARTYEALEVTFDVVEELHPDTDALDNAALDVGFTYSDGTLTTLFEEAVYPAS